MAVGLSVSAKTDTNKIILKQRLEKFSKYDILKDLKPVLSRQEFIILKDYLLTNNRTAYGICQEQGLFNSEFNRLLESTVNHVEEYYSRYQQIQYLLNCYGGKESVESMAAVMPKEQQDFLLNYMLNVTPDIDKLKGNRLEKSLKIETLEGEVLDLLDKIYPAKCEIDKMIEISGGKDFVFNVFAKSLSEERSKILKDYTLAYLPQNKSELASSLDMTTSQLTQEHKYLIMQLKNIIIVNKKLQEALSNPKVSGYRLKLPYSKIRKVLSAMPTIHQDFAKEYFLNETSLNQISRDTGLSLGSISARKKSFFRIFYEMSNLRDKDLVTNSTSKSYKTAQRYSRTTQMLTPYILKLASFEPDLNPMMIEDQKRLFQKYLYPYIEKLQIRIFEETMLSNTGESAETVAQRLGCDYQYIYNTENSIYSKLDYIIDKKIKIDEFYIRYDGKEGVDDFSKFLTPVQKIVLDNYYLSLDPNSNSKTLKLLNRTETGTNGFGSIRNCLTEKFEELLIKKRECQNFIKENGGIEFLTEFGKILCDEHREIFNLIMIDYHYTSLRDVSLKYGDNEGYARKVKSLILKKLKKVQEKAEWIDSLHETLSDNDIKRFSSSLNERELEILIKYTLNCFALKISDYCKQSGESHSYVSDVNNRLTKKLEDLVKIYS